jgi:hypothetical protein
MANVNKQSAINTFTKGMNKDLDLSVLPKEAYLHAQNFRLVTNEGSSTTALETIEGNSLLSSALPSGYTAIGSTTLRDEVIIFATNNTYSRIYLATLSSTNTFILTLLYDDSTTSDGSRLNFSTSNLIRAIGRYESPNIKKVYWTDNTNRIRFVNYAGGIVTIGSYLVSQFDIIPNYTRSSIEIDSLSSGSLKSGAVQYAYQLYNLNGASSFYSTTTNLIPLSNSLQTGSDASFNGSDQGTNSGKSVLFHINNVDTTFNRIRIVRLQHNTLVDLPEITIIEETVVTGTSMSFIDNGTQSLGTITSEEFNFSNYDFICKELETKNNILFAANITENNWDINYDARAFRYNSFGDGYITAEDGVSEQIAFTYSDLSGASPQYYYNGSATPTLGVPPETHDNFNTVNLSENPTTFFSHIYQGNGITLGGQGRNVLYSFSTESFGASSGLGGGNVVNNTNFTGITNSLTISEKVSHMRDEIYSYGVVLYNNKGQKSYVKWIGDIRFPSTANSTIYNTTGGRSIHNLYIQFTLNNLPTDCIAIQIVRCERTSQDRTVVAQGLLGATRETSTWYTASVAPVTIKEYGLGVQAKGTWTSNLNKTLLEFISPEISFGNNMEYSAGDKLEISSFTGFDNFWSKGQNTTAAFVNSAANVHIYDNSEVNITVLTLSGTGQITGTSSITINDFKIANFSNNPPAGNTDPIVSTMETTVNSISYENYIRAYGDNSVQGAHGTCGIISIPSAIVTTTTDTLGVRYFIANYKRYIKPYGGASYEARTRRTYLPVSDVFDVVAGSSTVLITKGDTFISWFEYQRVMVSGLDGQNAKSESMCQVVRFPVESSINTRWQSNTSFTQAYSNESNIPINLNAAIIQENAGAYSKVTSTITANYTQDKDLYSYNSVYSKQNNITGFYPKPIDITSNVVYDSRVIASEVKINGEEEDSWTKFKLLNFIDVDSKYGPISSLKTDNNNLLFWQSKGFGVLSVNVRSLISDNNTTALILGTGGVLDRYDYISTEAGNISQFGIISGKAGIYWFDSYNKTFYKYGQGVEPLSKIKGIQSYVNTFANKETICTGLHDTKFTENIFTLNNGTTKTTIAYNEIIDAFTSFYSYTPSIYIGLFDGRYITQNNAESLYLHNNGIVSEFYGNTDSSYITFVSNDNYQHTKIFDSLNYKTKVTSGDIELFVQTFNTFKVYNSKQNTGITSLNTSNTIKREGSFNVAIPRNAVNSNIETNVDILNPANLNTSRLFRERIRDKYSIITLTYDNTDGYKLSVPYVITNYRISYR